MWNPLPYKIIRRINPDGNVYEITPVDGGKTQTVNRSNLLYKQHLQEPVDAVKSDNALDSHEEQVDSVGSDETSSDSLFGIQPITDSDSAGTSEDFKSEQQRIHRPIIHKTLNVEDEDDPSSSSSSDVSVVSLRRSKRPNKGRHKNPYNLPRSCCNKLQVLEPQDKLSVLKDGFTRQCNIFENYCAAITKLT
ncbi:unnamed protein product [Owenia fusiformis]|uniref:Uncharacterized protein n=1 Tax=Owenia fusiformis TaxID=6347 RepID=A0A8J1UZQ7_OWEFU|nr:unnamed protein product [Owenia fusiformis]CAH1781998.1 unnamed protein product [Owenia fusiformis]